MAPDGKLSHKQEKAIAALLAEPTIQHAAKTAGVGERTLHTWLRDPVFADAYRQARREAVRRAVGRLQQAASEAVDALQEIASSPDAPAPSRVSAAKTVLELAIKATEIEELEARVEMLERALQQRRSPHEA